MSQYNENVICFVGDEGHMRNVILALAVNYERSEPRLAEKGLTYESPGVAGLSDRVAGQARIPDMVGELNQVCWDPLYALDPASEVGVGGDDLPEEAVACEKVRGADGGILWRLTMSFFSYGGLALDALAEFADSLPPDRYAIAAAYKWEYDDSVYANLGNEVDGGEYDYTPGHDRFGLFQPDEDWKAEEVRELVSSLREDAGIPSAEALAKEPVAEAMASWFGVGLSIVVPVEGMRSFAGRPYEGHLRAGDEVVLRSDWQSEQHQPVGIEVFDVSGRPLGYLAGDGNGWGLPRNLVDGSSSFRRKGSTLLACLLQHASARVDSVSASQGCTDGDQLTLSVRIELGAEVLAGDGSGLAPTVVESANRLMRKRKANREVTSRSPEGWRPSGESKSQRAVGRRRGVPKAAGSGRNARNWEEKRVEAVARKLPVRVSVDVTGQDDSCWDVIELMRPGNPLMLRMRIENKKNVSRDRVTFEVVDASGRVVGCLREGKGLRALRDNSCYYSKYWGLYLLMPYVVATVDSVTPRARRSDPSRGPILNVRMDLAPNVLDRDSQAVRLEVLNEIRRSPDNKARAMNSPDDIRLTESGRPTG